MHLLAEDMVFELIKSEMLQDLKFTQANTSIL